MSRSILTYSIVNSESSLPNSFMSEKYVISCLLSNPDAVYGISRRVSPEMFLFQPHKRLYIIMKRMSEKSIPPDIFNITRYLAKEKWFLDIGGPELLLELIEIAPELNQIDIYLQLMKDKFIKRKLIELGRYLAKKSYLDNFPTEQLLKRLERDYFLISDAENYGVNNKIETTMKTGTPKLLEDLFLELKNKFLNPGLPGIPSGFKTLDSYTQGFQKSDLIIIAGRPSMGKTALGLTIALNVMKEAQLPVVFFSLEMSKEQILYRILAMESNVDSKKFKAGNISEKEWFRLSETLKLMVRFPFFVEDSTDLTFAEIKARIKQVVIDHENIGLIVIDYLQLMQSVQVKNESRTQELSRITRYFKSLAHEFKVPIIFLSQLNRNIETRQDSKPLLSDLRESGSIEQDADLVLMLSKKYSTDSNLNKKYSKEIVDLFIAKHRNGTTGKIQLEFNKIQTKFIEI